MTTDMTAPATKLDIQLLMEQMADYYQKTEEKVTDLYEKTDKKMDEFKLHFDFSVEQVKGEIKMINVEKIEEHDAAIVQLQIHTGLRRAG